MRTYHEDENFIWPWLKTIQRVSLQSEDERRVAELQAFTQSLCHRFISVFVYITQRKLHGSLKKWMLFTRLTTSNIFSIASLLHKILFLRLENETQIFALVLFIMIARTSFRQSFVTIFEYFKRFATLLEIWFSRKSQKYIQYTFWSSSHRFQFTPQPEWLASKKRE